MRRILSKIENNLQKRRVRLFINRSLRKNKIGIDGKRFHIIGKSFRSIDEIKNYTEEVIDPTFKNIEIGLDQAVDNYRNYCENLKRKAEVDLKIAENMLSETSEKGFINFVQRKIDYVKEVSNKFKKTAEEDEKICTMIDGAITDSTTRRGELNSNYNPTNQILELKFFFDSLNYSIKRIRKERMRMSSSRHSSFYPPKIWIIIFFYLFSIVLFCAEFGITKSTAEFLIEGKQNQNKSSSIFLLSIGISASFVFIWKKILDRLLHISMLRTLFLFGIIVSTLTFLAFLFSYKDVSKALGDTLKMQALILGHFTSHGIILSFFSVSIAIGNALLLREAWYLQHLIWEKNKYGTLKKLERSIKKYSDKWSIIKITKEKEIESFNDEVNRYTTTQTKLGKDTLINLKKICIANLKKGYSEASKQ